ncbi:hypothetical protein B0J18DRAFT_478269 [Chaetomium sp. MPI-SDFR-AT-0129]|nr:hypothetical protein B0J18DRAFT_478269 [Chaetomium sp. MPI-SDFR-AT-0129]
MSTCEPLKGNSDFYGLGIRLGIYLQWASAWLNLLLHPDSAQGVLDANSVFRFAVAIATIVAADQDDTPSIELYIMLQILVGFPATVLSMFGVRIWLMNPGRLGELLRKIVETKRAAFLSVAERVKQTHGGPAGRIPVLQFLHPRMIRFWSPPKFPGLSWSGVTWRVIIVAMVVGYHAAYWFGKAVEPPHPGCGQLVIFMFSKQPLEEPIVTLGRVAAVSMAAIIVPPTLILIVLTNHLTQDAVSFLYRDLWFSVTLSDPQTFNDILRRINRVLENKSLSLGIPRETMAAPLTAAKSLLDLIEFMSAPNGDKIRFSDVLKVAVSLASKRQTKQRRLARICIAWTVFNVLTIVWFITSIETTIRWNNIQEVHTIDSTGQLIPFIIGVVSAAQVLKKLVLLALSKKYPDWAETQLEIHQFGHELTFQFVKSPGAVQTQETREGSVREGTNRRIATV